MELSVSNYATIPFVEKGRSEQGCDCWGLIYLIYRDLLDIELPLYVEEYQNTTDEKVLSAAIAARPVNWKETTRPRPGDAILMRLKGQPMHVGVYIGNGRFIHCLHGSGTVIEKIKSITWRNRIVGYYRYEK
ncbi:MAG: C40 family peptidase [Proteobacteria bacterium]|nr:C40 family peptidase [Pseudomonadota bacterium]